MNNNVDFNFDSTDGRRLEVKESKLKSHRFIGLVIASLGVATTLASRRFTRFTWPSSLVNWTGPVAVTLGLLFALDSHRRLAAAREDGSKSVPPFSNTKEELGEEKPNSDAIQPGHFAVLKEEEDSSDKPPFVNAKQELEKKNPDFNDPFLEAGKDVWHLIFKQLPINQLVRCREVCLAWNKFLIKAGQFGPDFELCKRHTGEPKALLKEEKIRECSIRYLDFQNFTTIDLNCSRLTDEGMELLGEKIIKCQWLETLILKIGPLITDRGFNNVARNLPATVETVALAGKKPLKVFDFTGCGNLTDEQLKAFLANDLQDIEVLKLAGCNTLTDASAKSLEGLVSEIRELHLGSMTDHLLRGVQFSQAALISLLSVAAKKLSTLCVAYCPGFTGNAARKLFCGNQFLTKLDSLDVTGCTNLPFGMLSWTLGKVSDLQHLSLGTNELIDDHVEKLLKGPIARMKSLRTLSLVGPKLTDKTFELLEEHLPYRIELVDLVGCTGLKTVVLKDSDDERARALLSALPGSVNEVRIGAEMWLTDTTLRGLKRRFKGLIVASPKATEKGIVEAAGSVSEKFEVDVCALSDEAIGELLDKLPKKTLTSLCLRNVSMTDAGLKQVADWVNESEMLTSLDLSGNADIRCLSPLIACLSESRVKTLSISGCRAIDWELVQNDLAKKGNPFTQLAELDVSNTAITDNIVEPLAGDDCKIKTLNCNYCTKLTEAALNPLIKKFFGGLAYHNGEVTSRKIFRHGNNFRLFFEGCVGITNLDLDSKMKHEEVTNWAIINIVNNCPNLTNLNLRRRWQLTDATVIALAKNYPALRSLNFSGCEKLTDQAIITLAKNCPDLTNLNLSRCGQLTDQAIITIANNCKGLTGLDLYKCHKLTDQAIFAITKNCNNLVKLNLGGCERVTNEAITALTERCKSLTHLELSGRKHLTDQAIITIAKHCPGLAHLDLAGCESLTDEAIITIVKLCPGLTHLDLAGRKHLTDEAVITIAKNCPGLTHLGLTGCGTLTDAAINGLAENCKGLTDLDLCGCTRLTDAAIMVLVKHCKKLTHVNFSGCWRLTGLTSLDLSGCKDFTSEALIAILSTCWELTSLNLTGCEHLTSKELTAIIKSCRGLTDLNLTGCKQLADVTDLDLNYCGEIVEEVFITIVENCPSLRSLKVQNSNSLGHKALIALAENCKGLTKLKLPFCDQVTDKGLIAIAKNCPGLTHLSLLNFSQLTDETVIAIAENCKGLTHLDLSGCGQLTDEAIVAIAENCKGLTHLDLSGCGQLTDEAIVAIAKNCSGLTSFNLGYCKKLTDESIVAIAKNCSGLTNFELTGCEKLTDKAIIAIANNCKKLTYLDLYGCKKIAYKTKSLIRKMFRNADINDLSGLWP